MPLELGELLLAARNEKRWSHQTLAERANVSTRTIFELETGKKKTARPVVIGKLAAALGKDLQLWLRAGGHPAAGEKEIQRIKIQVPGLRVPGEIDPVEYFRALAERIQKRKTPALMCVAYPSIPGSLHRLDVQKYLVDLLNTGLLAIAMVTPYPRIDKLEETTRTNLCAFYRNVHDQVLRLAKELNPRIHPDHKHNLAVFVPEFAQKEPLVMPTPGLSDYRTGLIKFYPETPDREPTYELVVWVTFQETWDRILRVYSQPEEQGAQNDQNEQAVNAMFRWKDYFADVHDSWTPTAKKQWRKLEGSASGWRPVPLG
jgi:transcriptional regulator with XRE-family HTH domain